MPGFWHFCITQCLGGQKGTNKVSKQQQVNSAKIMNEEEVKKIQQERQLESVENDSSKGKYCL
jgi:hypothetical protein